MWAGLGTGRGGYTGWCNILGIMEEGVELVSITDFMKRQKRTGLDH